MIRITSKQDGFWRVGVQHPKTPTDHADDRFTPEQMEALEAEPMLVVQRIPDEPPAGSGEGDEGKKGKGKGKKGDPPAGNESPEGDGQE